MPTDTLIADSARRAFLPTADFAEAWGEGFMQAGDFLAIVYATTR